MSSFQLVGLSPLLFRPLFRLSATELEALAIHRVVATSSRGYPCRVGLFDAQEGDELLLLTYQHQPARSPYKASGPIYVRVDATERLLGAGVIPDYVSRRQISVRAYDSAHMMVSAEVCDGAATGQEIKRQFDDPSVRYIHLHNAKRGCFSCLVQRVGAVPETRLPHLT